MRAWPSVPVPSLASQGTASLPRVHDSARGELVTSTAATEGGTARLYVCGITPYDATHLGHAATYLAFDLLVRAWLDADRRVTYVQNVTDVDDPLLERAAATGQDWRALADREIERFRADMTALRTLPPDHYIGAVESVPLVVQALRELVERGQAYEIDQGDWYFSVHGDPAFGRVSGLSDPEMTTLFAERGGDPDRAGKKHPLDCLLWRGERPGEPSWDSPWGPGRPGWHIECSAIAATYLGVGFDVQGGGSDLVFPHHEMSASEAHVLDASGPFAQSYVHAGMVAYEGEKMSKSRGNLVFVSALREQGLDPRHLRIALLGHHYRSDWEWFDDELPRAAERLTTWQQALRRTSLARAEQLVSEVRDALTDDLDAPRALDLLDAWAVSGAHEGGDPDGARLVVDLVDARLGIDL